MKIQDLFEAQRNKVILVDFQPSYDNGNFKYQKALMSACKYINNNPNVEVIAFFNGSDIGVEDTKTDVQFHYLEYGLNEECLYNITFTEKIYSFLRPWMDLGVDPGQIKQALRYMLINKIADSRDIPEEVYKQLLGDYNIHREDNIFLPNIAINQLKLFNNSLMGGGARSECFKEMQILMSAFNIKHKEVQQWIYD